MKDIDWSKAPEWANVFLGPACGSGNFAWAESFSDESRYMLEHGSGHNGRLNLIGYHNWKVISDRPAAQEWNGTGLPPVGAVCECQNDKFQWLRGTIVYVGRDRGDKLAVMQTDTEMLYGSVGEFRPIRTPEQIAAEERIAAINYMEIDAGMCATAFDGDPEARVWIENLIDKGWRKAGGSE